MTAVAVLVWSLVTVGLVTVDTTLGTALVVLDIAVESPPGGTLANDPVDREDVDSSSNTRIRGRPNCGTAETARSTDASGMNGTIEEIGGDLPEVIDKKMHERAVAWRNVPALTKVGRKRIIFIAVFVGNECAGVLGKREKDEGLLGGG